MSQIELAVTLSRRLESLLEEKHQATGKGLHEKVSSVEGRLPSQLVKEPPVHRDDAELRRA